MLLSLGDFFSTNRIFRFRVLGSTFKFGPGIPILLGAQKQSVYSLLIRMKIAQTPTPAKTRKPETGKITLSDVL